MEHRASGVGRLTKFGRARLIAMRLTEEGGSTNAHFQVWWALGKAMAERRVVREHSDFAAFFDAAVSGSYQAVFIGLSKIFDRDRRAVGISHLRKALIAAGHGALERRLGERLASVKHLVKKIKTVRSKSIAHSDARMAGPEVYEKADLRYRDMEKLVGVACEVINEAADALGLSVIDVGGQRYERSTLAVLDALVSSGQASL